MVGFADIGDHALFVVGEDGDPHAILLPSQGGLCSAWLLAHELGHLVQHHGPKGETNHDKEEAQADRWASCALIPEHRIRAYSNASLDAFIAALSANYEDIPLRDCPPRRLAAKIASIRLRALEEVA